MNDLTDNFMKEVTEKRQRGCYFSLAFFFAFAKPFAIVAIVRVIPGYWQNVLLVIVCLMDQTILIEFNYIAFPCSLGGCSRLVVGFSDLQ